MSQQEIYQIAHQLKQQGKTPSVALIKSQLSVSMPLAAIIKGLQQWQKNPALGETKAEQPIETATPADTNASPDLATLNQQVTSLQQQVATMKVEMDELKKVIAELKAK